MPKSLKTRNLDIQKSTNRVPLKAESSKTSRGEREDWDLQAPCVWYPDRGRLQGGSTVIGIKYVAYLPGLKGEMNSECPSRGAAPREWIPARSLRFRAARPHSEPHFKPFNIVSLHGELKPKRARVAHDTPDTNEPRGLKKG
jgi:hypothetical protein